MLLVLLEWQELHECEQSTFPVGDLLGSWLNMDRSAETKCSCLHAVYRSVCVNFRIHPNKQNVFEIVTPLRVFYIQVKAHVVH